MVQLVPSLLCEATAHALGIVEGMPCVAQTILKHIKSTQIFMWG